MWRGIEKEKTRGEGTHWGIKDGIDQGMTIKLYHKSDIKKKETIRKILVCVTWTRARLAHFPNPPCTEECPCGLRRETLKHLWWDCPRWTICREKFEEQRGATKPEDMTIATRELGIFPAETPTDMTWIQEMMVAIFIAIYSSFGP